MITRWDDKQLLDITTKSGKDKVQKIMYRIEREMKWFASGNAGGPNVDKGHFRRSITTEVEVNGTLIEGRAGSNLNEPPYPMFLELGTRKMRPYPWARPALYGVIGYIKNKL